MNNELTKPLDQEELEHYILDAMEKWKIPGLSIALVKDGKTVLVKGYGAREVNKNLPVNEHTLFAISWATQSFTAASIALLVAEGKMSWDDRLIDLLPGFKTGSDLVTNYATVTDALANRTGLADEVLAYDAHPNLSRTDLLGRMKELKSSNEFRSQLSPNTLMTVAVGEIIPALTGTSWDDFVRERLFGPVGMTDSITGPHLSNSHSNIVTPHEPEAGKVIPISHARSSNIGPAASIYTSAADMAKWLSFQLNNGKVGDKTIIPESEIKTMRSSYIPANFDFPGISKRFINQSLGLLISDSSMGCQLYSNGGGTEGMEFYHAFVPELDLGIAVMVNSRIALPQRIVAWIIDRYTDAPRKDWADQVLPVFAKARETRLSGLETKRIELTDSSKKPSLALASYEGLYHHALLGDLRVEVDTDTEELRRLSFTLGSTYQGDLLHTNNDTFFIKVKTPLLGKFILSGPAQFRLDQAGEVSSLFVMEREFQKVAL